MNKPRSEDFYQNTYDWVYDLYQNRTLWLRRSLLVIAVLMLLLTLSLLSNLFLFPLKEKVPYLYAFDHANGEITKIGELEPTVLSGNWALTRYLLIQYVSNYEGYDSENIDHPYQLVWAQSADTIRQQYESWMKSDNPESPYRQYGKSKFVSVQVNSINRLNDNTVDIKYTKSLRDKTTNSELKLPKEAIVKWEFSQAETTQKMLDRDPLGFKVTYLHIGQVAIDDKLGG